MRSPLSCHAVAWALCPLALRGASTYPMAAIVGPWEQSASSATVGTEFPKLFLQNKSLPDAAPNCSLFARLVEAGRRRRRHVFQFHDSRRVIETARHEQLPIPHSSRWAKRLTGVGMSCIAGLSTALGAAIVFLLPSSQATPAQMAFILALAGGVMLSITLFEFWLPALTSSESSLMQVTLWSAVGAMSFMLLSRLMPEPQFVNMDVEAPMGCMEDAARQCKGTDRSKHLATIMLLSLSVHNFPEGFAVAVSSLGSGNSGLVVMLAVALHNIPEGIAIAVPVLEATGSRRKALCMTMISGLAEPMGALLALLFVDIIGVATQQNEIESLLCVVGGVMFAVAVKELLPEAWGQREPTSFGVGLLFGVLLMFITTCLGA